MTSQTAPSFTVDLARDLLALKAAGGLTLTETGPRSGVHRYAFRVGGWPIVIDIDETVLELRAYFDRDALATGRLRPEAMDALLGHTDLPSTGTSAKEARDSLRGTVRRWLDGNARLFVKSPAVARHADNWNNA